MNIDFENQKKELQKDTSFLQNIINHHTNLSVSDLLNFLDSSWYLPIINLAVENDNTEIIRNVLNKTDDTDLINKDVLTKRDLNRKKLLKVFFKKKI
jgi:hypothetical protein